MRGAAVVPQKEIAQSPDVLVDEFGLLGVVEHRVEKRLGLGVGHAFEEIKRICQLLGVELAVG